MRLVLVAEAELLSAPEAMNEEFETTASLFSDIHAATADARERAELNPGEAYAVVDLVGEVLALWAADPPAARPFPAVMAKAGCPPLADGKRIALVVSNDRPGSRASEK